MNIQDASAPPIVSWVSPTGWRIQSLPECGGRIVSLSDPSGHEWLAKSGRRWPTEVLYRWIDGDTQGWDECFPNISPGRQPVTGTHLPDHGDLWNSRARCEVREDGALVTSWHSRCVDARFTRSITEVDGALDVHYTCEAAVGPVGWAMHLLLDVDHRSLDLDVDAFVRVDSRHGTCRTALDPAEHWSTWGPLSRQLATESGGWACKLNTRPGDVSCVAVESSGRRLEVSTSVVPVRASFGLWLNAGGLDQAPELRHVGVEPAFGDHDDLGSCWSGGSALAASDLPTTWHVQLRSTTAGSAHTRPRPKDPS